MCESVWIFGKFMTDMFVCDGNYDNRFSGLVTPNYAGRVSYACLQLQSVVFVWRLGIELTARVYVCVSADGKNTSV